MRRQLSLFIPTDQAGALEAVRARLDPVQYALIPAHVTACRDAETAELVADDVARRLAQARVGPLSFTFGRAEMFYGHGVYLPCVSGADGLARLRRAVLGAAPARAERPHVTLAHPRNPPGPDYDAALADRLPARIVVTCPTLSLIEQDDPGAPWRTSARFEL
ncbi:MAG: 2'-5' RNA ligase family protein [Pseudomonadota bacterium]